MLFRGATYIGEYLLNRSLCYTILLYKEKFEHRSNQGTITNYTAEGVEMIQQGHQNLVGKMLGEQTIPHCKDSAFGCSTCRAY